MSVSSAGNPTLGPNRFNRVFPWICAAILVAGVVTFLIARYGNTAEPPGGARVGKGPVATAKTPPTVKVSPEARTVAGRFILTAVARENLAEAWTLITPSMKRACGCTFAEWKQGDINVVPFPAADISFAPFKTDWSYKRDLALEVALLSKSGRIKSQIFVIHLKKPGKRWLVDYWAPRGGGVPIPSSVNG